MTLYLVRPTKIMTEDQIVDVSGSQRRLRNLHLRVGDVLRVGGQTFITRIDGDYRTAGLERVVFDDGP
jgi:hypothetical protein